MRWAIETAGVIAGGFWAAMKAPAWVPWAVCVILLAVGFAALMLPARDEAKGCGPW